MRIIAGSARGRKLKAPKGPRVRPTLDKVKGAIFNILGDKIIDAEVLDLFCGSGALGIEALSRGAVGCVFVDADVRCVKDNLKSAGFEGRVIKGSVDKIIKRLDQGRKKFDVVLADPPYEKNLARNLLNWLWNSGILKDYCYIVIEHSKRETIDREKFRERQYGDTVVSIFRYEPR